MRYRKKPIEVDAMQWDGTTLGATEIIEWILNSGDTARYHFNTHIPSFSCIEIDTAEGTMQASSGDYVIKEPFPTDDRMFYPCKPSIFESTYEPVT